MSNGVPTCLADLEPGAPATAQMLLATGKNFPLDAGDFRACSSHPLSLVATYFLVKATVHGPINAPVSMGLCLPSSCEHDDAMAFVTSGSPHGVQLPYNISFTDVKVTEGAAVVQPWDAGATVACIVLGLLVFCSVVGTLLARLEALAARNTSVEPLNTSVEPLMAAPATRAPPQVEEAGPVAAVELPAPKPAAQARLQSFFANFEVARNASRMVAVPKPQPTDCLNGIR
eukprot:6331083-Prymnesium_polylepis.1